MGVLDIATTFLASHPYSAYFILFFGSYLECIIGINFFIRGEIFFITGAILAGVGYLNIWYVAIACIVGGLLGDSSSYYMGRKYGKIVVGRIFKDSNKYLTLKRYQAGEKVLHEKGLKSIFFARFMGPLAWVTPFIAGAMQVKYKDFIKHNAPGAVVGIGLFLFAGYIFGASASMLLPKFFKGIFVIALILAAIAVWLGIGRAKRLSKIRHGFKKRI